MKILFFASIRDRLDTDEETLSELCGVNTINDLRKVLIERGEPWQSVLKDEQLLVALNQELVSLDAPVGPNDEIAFMPPVTGG